MWRVMVKGLVAHRGRMIRTAIAVMLGVSFVAGTYVLTDTLSSLFDTIMGQSTAGITVVVRGQTAFVKRYSADTDRQPVPEDLLRVVQAVPGVRGAMGAVGGYAQLVDANGKPIVNGGAPTFGQSWAPPPLGSITLRSGRAPQSGGEVALDAATVRKHGFRLGDPVRIMTAGPLEGYTLVGILGFGKADNMAGATMAVFDLATAQQKFGKGDTFDMIDVLGEPGIPAKNLAARVSRVLPKGFEAVPGTVVSQEYSDLMKTFLNYMRTALLVFAVIALFVAAFIIFNTFGITVAQRTREFALLRSLGASPRQVMASVLGEAVAIGVIASAAGIVGGIGLAIGLQGLLKGLGMDLPGSGIRLLARTVLVSAAIGLGVTCVSALRPARRAATVPPLAAVREVSTPSGRSLHRRAVSGAIVTAAGVGLLVWALFAGPSNALVIVGLGALAIFLGVTALSALVAPPVAALVGVPLRRLAGVAGGLARQNAARNARRTATTAAALMIGVALIAFMLIFSASIKASSRSGLDKALYADLIVVDAQQMGVSRPFSPDVAKRLAARPEVAAVSPLRIGEWRLNGATKSLAAVDPQTIGRVAKLDVRSGSVLALRESWTVLVSDRTAREMGLKLGDVVSMEYSKTGSRPATVVGIYRERAAVQQDFVISLQEYEQNFTNVQDTMVYVKGAPGVSRAQLRRGVQWVADGFPNVTVVDQAGLLDRQAKGVDQMMSLVTALLGLAVVIALIGIANTLGLSVMERTRELGLLRAVGMSRRQTRAMIRWEAVIIAILGTLLGVAIGVFFGWAVRSAMSDQGFTALAIPVRQLVLYMVGAVLAAVVAALLPARRAARMDVLSAITTE